MINLLKFLAVVVILTMNALINGFVLSKLWLWFAVPVFDVRSILVVEAIGLALLVGFLRRGKYEENKEGFWKSFGVNTAYSLFSAAFVLLLGWIVTLFM